MDMGKKLTLMKESVEAIAESDIQREFETNLGVLEENLQYIDSFIRIGLGMVMDTLAVDSNLKPVIIEFKKPDASDQDALIQSLDYYI